MGGARQETERVALRCVACSVPSVTLLTHPRLIHGCDVTRPVIPVTRSHIRTIISTEDRPIPYKKNPRFYGHPVFRQTFSHSTTTMHSVFRRQATVSARHFTSRAVNGFTGAVGNTPLVCPSALRSTTSPDPNFIHTYIDLPQGPFRKDRLSYLWKG